MKQHLWQKFPTLAKVRITGELFRKKKKKVEGGKYYGEKQQKGGLKIGMLGYQLQF